MVAYTSVIKDVKSTGFLPTSKRSLTVKRNIKFCNIVRETVIEIRFWGIVSGLFSTPFCREALLKTETFNVLFDGNHFARAGASCDACFVSCALASQTIANTFNVNNIFAYVAYNQAPF